MKAKIAFENDEGIGVVLFDQEDNEHRIKMNWDGEVIVHQQDAYPHSEAERTEEQERIMRQVQERALFEAHHETDADVLDPDWVPMVLQQAADAVRVADRDDFVEWFRPLYDAVREPERFVDEPDLDVVTRVRQGLFLHEDDGHVVAVSDPAIQYDRTDGTTHTENPAEDPPAGTVPILISLPHLTFEREDFTFPESFRALLVNHFYSQIRDVYLNMGEEPPEEYRVEGYGKIATLHGGIPGYDE